MKSAIALKSFNYAHDGIRPRELAKDEPFECRDELFDGLMKEGFIKSGKDAAKSDADAKAQAEADAQAKAKAKAKS